MYNKRSAWILTGIAFTETPTIKDIIIAVQTEIPISKQNEFSFLYAVEGEGAYEEIYEKSSMACVTKSKRLLSGQAEDLKDGFVCFPNPFPGTKLIISSIYEDFYNNVFPHKNINEAKVFSDEYISTGGHVYLLASGCYRIVADLREYVQTIKNSLCCHPYDLCTVLLAIEAGAQISDISNHDLSYPLDTTTNCNWIGFSNIILKRKYGDLLLNAINKQKAIV